MVLAFRGTKSLQNMVTDVKLWRTAYQAPHRRGVVAVLVHAGFYSAWKGSGFNERVLQLVGSALKDAGLEESGKGDAGGAARFVVTGERWLGGEG